MRRCARSGGVSAATSPVAAIDDALQRPTDGSKHPLRREKKGVIPATLSIDRFSRFKSSIRNSARVRTRGSHGGMWRPAKPANPVVLNPRTFRWAGQAVRSRAGTLWSVPAPPQSPIVRVIG